jgi:hypothetical protein
MDVVDRGHGRHPSQPQSILLSKERKFDILLETGDEVYCNAWMPTFICESRRLATGRC